LAIERRFSLRNGTVGVVALVLSVVGPRSFARADEPNAENVAAARMLGTEGVKLAQSGDCNAAIPKLEAAEKLFHAPTTAEWLGECDIKVGKIVVGTELLSSLVHEVLPPNAPAAFAAAQRRAQDALPAALPKIARLKIHVDAPATAQLSVTVDGVRVPAVLLDAERPTDPGQHEVKAVAQGFLAATSPVTLAPGGSGSVALKLEPDPNAQPAATTIPSAGPAPTGSAAPTASATGTPPPPVAKHDNLPAYIALGAGGVGLAVGAIFGAMALGTKGSLDSACTNKICPSTKQGDINSLGTQATLSSVGFGVGVVGAAVGVILLVTSGGNAPSQEGHPAAQRGFRVSPWVVGNGLGLEGTFE
jgi:hypothetical protein